MAGERERLCAYLRRDGFGFSETNLQAADLLEADAAELARKDKALQAVEWYLMKGGDAIKIMDKVMAALASPRNEAQDKGEGE